MPTSRFIVRGARTSRSSSSIRMPAHVHVRACCSKVPLLCCRCRHSSERNPPCCPLNPPPLPQDLVLRNVLLHATCAHGIIITVSGCCDLHMCNMFVASMRLHACRFTCFQYM